MNKKIAVIILAYNEEKRIEYLLESVKMFDDIIFLDKNSTDNTLNIARKYTSNIYTVPYTDITTDEGFTRVLNQALEETECDWMLLLTCSDIVHPDFYQKASQYIKEHDVDVVNIPMYRYSMGFISKYSFYQGLHYKDILLKKSVYQNDPDIHVMTKYNSDCKVGTMRDENHQIAVYHLTHENLELILERHLRYAKAESICFTSREEGLKKTWWELLRQVYYYFKMKTYKLGEKGKAQLCMLLLYRSARYLNVYFSKEKEAEIKAIYDDIRINKTDKNC